MHIDSLYSSELYEETYKNCKYFNQRPWNVAMSNKVREEFQFYDHRFRQLVVDGKKDMNEYLVLLRLVLDGPLIFFEN